MNTDGRADSKTGMPNGVAPCVQTFTIVNPLSKRLAAQHRHMTTGRDGGLVVSDHDGGGIELEGEGGSGTYLSLAA